MSPVHLTCLCGKVQLELTTRPEFIHECNCTLCCKTGARWAYPVPADVVVDGETTTFCRQDKADPSAEVHFCPGCGSTTHFTLTASAVDQFGNAMMGVNMRLAEEAAIAGIELRYPDGRGWSGAGEYGYVRPTVILGS